MSSSTTQPKSNGAAQADNVDAYQRELQKKIRNKQKKLSQITDLEKKIKSKEIEPKEEQMSKIRSKAGLESEIEEIQQYQTLYLECLKE
jgi:predicted  nucleic acid-binding Zn-ribbon protein